MAAVVGSGPKAALSHGSAAALWGMGVELVGLVEVSLRSASSRRREGLRIHRRPSLRIEDIVRHRGIPATSPVLTLIDMATRSGRARVERMVNEADRLDLISPEGLRSALDLHPGEPGVARLRQLLDRRTFRLTAPGLEQLFLPLAVEAGLPIPLTKQWVNGFEVDFYWPALGLLVETDGLRYHRTPSEQARDRLRDQAHTASGLSHLRFTHEQVKFEPEHVLATLRATARLLLAGVPSSGEGETNPEA
jgi:hypothetical protein